MSQANIFVLPGTKSAVSAVDARKDSARAIRSGRIRRFRKD